MEKKENGIKRFVKEHKTEIRNAAIVLGVGLLGGVIGCTMTRREFGKNFRQLNDNMSHVINDAITKCSNHSPEFTAISDVPLKADDLGKLGEELKKLPKYDDRMTFTHFIGIGPNIEK